MTDTANTTATMLARRQTVAVVTGNPDRIAARRQTVAVVTGNPDRIAARRQTVAVVSGPEEAQTTLLARRMYVAVISTGTSPAPAPATTRRRRNYYA